MTNKIQEQSDELDEKLDEIADLNNLILDKDKMIRNYKEKIDQYEADYKSVKESISTKTLEIERLTENLGYLELENERF